MNGVTMTVCAAMAAISLVSPVAHGQHSPAQRQSFIAATVADLDASVRWYETYLGAHRVAASRAPSGFAENVTVANDYLMVELIHFAATAATDTAIRDPRAVGLQKAGAWVDRATFDWTLDHLQRLRASFVGGVFSDSATNARSFIVKDNSGVLIQLFTSIR